MLGYRQTAAVLQTRLSKGRPTRNRTCTWLQRLLQLMILDMGKMPRGVPALEEAVPAPEDFAGLDGQQLGDLLLQEMKLLDQSIDASWRKFGLERVATHPWLGPLRAEQWRRFHAVHGEHHLVQLRAVLAQVAPVQIPVRINSRLVKERQVPSQRPLTQKNAV